MARTWPFIIIFIARFIVGKTTDPDHSTSNPLFIFETSSPNEKCLLFDESLLWWNDMIVTQFGNSEDFNVMGQLCMFNNNYSKAEMFFRRAIHLQEDENSHDGSPLYGLAGMYEKGNVASYLVDDDDLNLHSQETQRCLQQQGAFYYYLLAANKVYQHKESQYKVAEYYENGIMNSCESNRSNDNNVDVSLSEAMLWFSEAAKSGHMIAQYRMGEYYFQIGHRNDLNGGYSIALNNWISAAEQGYDKAQERLGFMYEEGRGVESNLTLAISWYHQAALQNNIQAQVSLGLIYEGSLMYSNTHTFGDNSILREVKDSSLAEYWYRRAGDQGHAAALYNLQTMVIASRPLCKHCQAFKRRR